MAAKLDIQKFWRKPPPEPSPGLLKWQKKIAAGWTPNSRIRQLDYYSSAEFFGVYIWEYLNVLRPMLYE